MNAILNSMRALLLMTILLLVAIVFVWNQKPKSELPKLIAKPQIEKLTFGLNSKYEIVCVDRTAYILHKPSGTLVPKYGVTSNVPEDCNNI